MVKKLYWIVGHDVEVLEMISAFLKKTIKHEVTSKGRFLYESAN